jgi:thymidylate synthase (FAD)
LKLIKTSFQILTDLNNPTLIYQAIEKAGRTAYRSEGKITDTSYEKFIQLIKSKNHESVLEHQSISVKFIMDRGLTHEIVRHRLSSFTQESTRYCNYSDDKFGNDLTFINIEPFLKNPFESMQIWMNCIEYIEKSYLALIELGETPQIARSVLPNSLASEIVVTANMRQWRHIFDLRTSKAAHPQMSDLMIQLLKEFKEKLPLLFDDINPNE